MPSPETKCILDTNVLLTADGKSDAGIGCIRAAKARLEEVRQHGGLVLDAGFLILKEYGNKLSPVGPNTPGNAFLKWLWQNKANPAFVDAQTALETAADGSFTAFPPDPDLAAFDPSDRKFVALALTHPERPVIVNATDTDWHKDHLALARHGVRLEFLCPDEMLRHRA
ncbi:hypothetical protein E5K00_07720 [Hymenobacter aquaticus]|uniref:PIN domain-containing protein n=1 Tax=Hymenobacter aquaticus TaxID=1867101 RepID=A0A4Z0Q6J8_9BACT|nr:hypothetical protein [Hymenobacter aquaticus]TGE25076.1 hypothetical protein E5K00_07720 [Hymenobacter aquaticus]